MISYEPPYIIQNFFTLNIIIGLKCEYLKNHTKLPIKNVFLPNVRNIQKHYIF